MAQEIERKWLLKMIPPTASHLVEISQAEQFYVSVEPEVRLRAYLTNKEKHIPYRLCIKGNGALCREEIQEEISEEFYHQVNAFVGKRPIHKGCYNYVIDGHEICISDVDFGAFVYAEVEFDSIEEAQVYKFPFEKLVIEEVTNNPAYKMKNYWIKTRLA